jgi:hypothetical protein
MKIAPRSQFIHRESKNHPDNNKFFPVLRKDGVELDYSKEAKLPVFIPLREQ